MAAATARPFLMFEGRAAEAMGFYAGLFEDGAILQQDLFPAEAGPAAGKVLRGMVRVAGLEVMCFDSPAPHAFSFTPAVSLFVVVDSEAEVRRLAAALGEGGQALMPLGEYDFSRLFAWVVDRFGVSWQIDLR